MLLITQIKTVGQCVAKPSRSVIMRVCVAALSWSLVACGDNTKFAGEPNNTIIDGSGLAPVVGSIDGFGSIIIDGIRYNTDEAKVFTQGQSSTEGSLAIGDYITLLVRTDEDDRTLESGDVVEMVFYEAPVIGAITAIDLSDNALAIANQIIRLSSNTLFDSNLGARSISDLALGDRVEVSGPSNNDGDIIATRIYAARQTQDVLSGLVFSQDEADKTFRLQGVVVDYSSAAVVNDFDNGDSVSVTGVFNPATQQIVATSVRLRDDRITPKELEDVPFIVFGLVEGYELGDTFEVSSYSVMLAPETRFVGGNIEALQNNQLITVIGSLDSDGVVQAATIELDSSFDLDLFTDPDFEDEEFLDEVDEPLDAPTDTPSESDSPSDLPDEVVEEGSVEEGGESNAEEESINGESTETESTETENAETETTGAVVSIALTEEGIDIGVGNLIEKPVAALELSNNSTVIVSEETLFYILSDSLPLDEEPDSDPVTSPSSGQLTPDQLADVLSTLEENTTDDTLPVDDELPGEINVPFDEPVVDLTAFPDEVYIPSDEPELEVSDPSRAYTDIDALQQGTEIRVEGYFKNQYFIARAIEIKL